MTPNPNPSPELKPCPFCGSPEVYPQNGDAWRRDTGTPFQFIWCIRCNTKGAEHPTEAEAITAWNTRALTPPTPAETVTVALPGAGEVDYEQALRSFISTSGAALASTDPKHVRFNAADMIAFAQSLTTVATANDEGVARATVDTGEYRTDYQIGKADGIEAAAKVAAGSLRVIRRPKDHETADCAWNEAALSIAAAIRLLSQGGGKA